jgi:allantoin racemase
MRIKIINPNTSTRMTETIRNLVTPLFPDGPQLVFSQPAGGPESIESFTDEYLAIPGVLEEIISGEAAGCDAYVIACFGDPGLTAAREIVDKPVVGIAEAAMYVARMLAPSFSIVDVLDRSRHMTNELVHAYRMEPFCRSIRTTGLGVIDSLGNSSDGLQEIERQCRLAIEEDGCESIVMGCAGFIEYAKELRMRLEVPVIEGIAPAIRFAADLVGLQYTTSKINSLKFPERKRIVGYDVINRFLT